MTGLKGRSGGAKYGWGDLRVGKVLIHFFETNQQYRAICSAAYQYAVRREWRIECMKIPAVGCGVFLRVR